MKWIAKFEHGEWVISNQIDGGVIFRSDTMEEFEAMTIIRAVNAYDELSRVAGTLVSMAKKFKEYDAAYNSDSLDELARSAEAALAPPSVQTSIVISSKW